MRLYSCQIFFAALVLLTTSALGGLLDKTAWDIDVTPTRQTADKGAKSFKDVLTFSEGKAASAELKRFGIGAVRYSADGANGFYNWKTTPALKKKSAAEWAGVLNGRNIEGNLRWFTRDDRVLYYYIRGRKQ